MAQRKHTQIWGIILRGKQMLDAQMLAGRAGMTTGGGRGQQKGGFATQSECSFPAPA